MKLKKMSVKEICYLQKNRENLSKFLSNFLLKCINPKNISISYIKRYKWYYEYNEWCYEVLRNTTGYYEWYYEILRGTTSGTAMYYELCYESL